MIKKIVIIGPESTGKTILSEQLARHFDTMWCPEYAREYLLQNGIQYNYDDLLKIAQGQVVMEDYCESVLNAPAEQGEFSNMNRQTSNVNMEAATPGSHAAANSPLLFIDTNLYVIKVWYEYVFGKCEQFVLDEITRRNYDLYLLCNIDLPWVAEPMREYPDEGRRIELYKIYSDILINQQTPWTEITGNLEQRLQKAIDAVQRCCILNQY